MPNIRKKNFTKKNISEEINLKLGFSTSYANEITDDFLFILKNLIKNKELNIKNFGKFKTINKSERLGRNPKNKKIYRISARKTLSFIMSRRLMIR
jgi:nucleoid DNA-binding protein